MQGAFDARLHPQLRGPERVTDRSGFAALAGLGVLLAGIVVAANGPVHYDEYGSYRDGAAALPVLVLAMTLLLFGLYRVVRRLPRGAAAAPPAMSIAIVCGLSWSMMPWLLPLAVVFLVSVSIVAAEAWRTGIWPAWLTFPMIVLLAVPAAVFAALLTMPWYTARESPIVLLLAFVPFGAAWLGVGFGLLRGFPAAAEAP